MSKSFNVLSYDDVVANFGKNKLRSFPGRNKGKSRILPYAKPQITTNLQFKDSSKFFIAGNCYGRQIERALQSAGCEVTSTPKDLSLPGTVLQQYNRYNVYHQDVATNEIAWAIDPNAPPSDDAFVVVDDEWADMQLNFSFAHPKEQARQFRSTFNDTYRQVKYADVVIVTTGGIELWFDAQTRLYLNSMPTNRMVELYPDRFELHRFNQEKCEESLHRTVDVILDNSEVDPIVFITASPVFQPTVFNTEDNLIEQTYARALQRVAAERVCSDYDRVEYLPGLEFTDLSDRQFGFSDHSYNHTAPCMTNRLTAEFLEKYQGPTAGQKTLYAIGHSEALVLAEDYQGATQVCKDAIADGATLTTSLDLQYLTALSKELRGAAACEWIMERLNAQPINEQVRFAKAASVTIRTYGTRDQVTAFLDVVKNWDHEGEAMPKVVQTLTELVVSGKVDLGGNARAFVAEIGVLYNARRYEEAVTRCEQLFEMECDPKAKTAALKFLDKIFYLSGMAKIIPFLLIALSQDEDIEHIWKVKLMRVGRSANELETINKIIGMKDKLADLPGFNNFVLHMESAKQQADAKVA